MTKKSIHLSAPSTKKAYKAPKLKSLGSVKKLTLKSGSAVDGFGTFA
jgi:hypothetical protein